VILQKTLDREKAISEQMDIYTIWECHYDELMNKVSPELKEQLGLSCAADDYEETITPIRPRQSLTGGRCEAICGYFDAESTDQVISSFDATSKIFDLIELEIE